MTGAAVTVPLLSANEPEAVVVSWAVGDGDAVVAGDVIAVLENTKSTEEVLADSDGFVVAATAKAGDRVTAGDTLCWLAPTADWRPPAAPETAPSDAGDDVPAGLRITKPALELARSLDVDLTSLPVGPLVTGDMVRARAGRPAPSPSTHAPAAAEDPDAIVVFGAGPHGLTLIDLVASSTPYRVVGVVDDARSSGDLGGVPLLGGPDALAALVGAGVRMAANGASGLRDPHTRVAVFEQLQAAGLRCPVLVHRSAVVEPSSELADGVQVLALAYIGSEARVGRGSIVNTAAVVSHRCEIGVCVNVSPGALLAGQVTVGDGSVIGMGVTVNIGVRIGTGARIGNGARVHADVPDGSIVRAGVDWSG